MDIIIKTENRLDKLIKLAKLRCEKYGVFDGINQLGISGGKDSTALYLLAYELDVPEIIPTFCDTDNESPITLDYVHNFYKSLDSATPIQTIKKDPYTEIDFEKKRERFKEKWSKPHVIRAGIKKGEIIPPMPEALIKEALSVLKPSGNIFLDTCLMHGMFPLRRSQFCTHELKLEPVMEKVLIPSLEKGKQVFSWSGVRRLESRKRKTAKCIQEDLRDETGFLFIFQPLINWKVEDVFAMHERHNIEPNPLYKQGMGRVGCMPCINCGKEEIRQISNRFPEHIDRIEEWEKIITKVSRWCQHEGRESSFLGAGISSEKNGGNVRELVEWSKTGRKRNYDLFKSDESDTSCSSKYGLCE